MRIIKGELPPALLQAGTDDVTTNFGSKDELNFIHRLISGFRISRNPAFWAGGFSPIPRAALYPDNERILAAASDAEIEALRPGIQALGRADGRADPRSGQPLQVPGRHEWLHRMSAVEDLHASYLR